MTIKKGKGPYIRVYRTIKFDSPQAAETAAKEVAHLLKYPAGEFEIHGSTVKIIRTGNLTHMVALEEAFELRAKES